MSNQITTLDMGKDKDKIAKRVKAHEWTEYDQKAAGILEAMGVTFKEKYIDSSCPVWKGEKCDHIHGAKYKITLKSGAKSFSFSFWNSSNDEDNGVKPRPYSVLACLEKNDPGTLENFCGNFGCDTDSRMGEKIYKAVLKQWHGMRHFFTTAELEELEEIQ